MLIAEYSYEDDIKVQRQESWEEGREEGVKALIKYMQEEGKSSTVIRSRICREFHLSAEEADQYLNQG